MVSSSVNTEGDFGEYRGGLGLKNLCLSSAVSALLPPAVVHCRLSGTCVAVSPFVNLFWIITFGNICNVVSVCHLQLLFHQLC